MNDPYLAFSSNFMDRLIQARTYKDRLAMEERQENRYQQQFDQNLELSKRSLGLREKEFEVNKDLRDQNFLFQKQKDEENRIFRDRQIGISQERADIARREHENKWGTPEEQEQQKIEDEIEGAVNGIKNSKYLWGVKNYTKSDIQKGWGAYSSGLDMPPEEIEKRRVMYVNAVNQAGDEYPEMTPTDLSLPNTGSKGLLWRKVTIPKMDTETVAEEEYELGQTTKHPKTGVEYYYAGNNQWATKSEWEKMNK